MIEEFKVEDFGKNVVEYQGMATLLTFFAIFVPSSFHQNHEKKTNLMIFENK